MHGSPLISVIVPTYNRAYIIKNAIRSILDQTYGNWELLVIDDGSNDDTKTVVEAFRDDRILYSYQNNQGDAAARNYGISLSKSKWITYLDSDDELLPECLATLIEWLGKNPQAVFAFPRAHRTLELYENGKLVKLVDDSEDTPTELTLKDIFMKRLHVAVNGFIHLRSLADEGVHWNQNLKAMADWDYAMQIGEKYPDGFVYIPVVLYNYHQRFGGDGLVSNTTYSDWADIFEQIYQLHKDDKLLTGQDWYPSRVEKWNRLQAEFEAGKQPPYQRYYFQDA